MRDTSLDDFAGGSEDDGSEDDGSERREQAAEPPDGDDPDDGSAVEPAVSTFDWTPGGATCGACGEDAERRWRDDGELVCASCKSW